MNKFISYIKSLTTFEKILGALLIIVYVPVIYILFKSIL